MRTPLIQTKSAFLRLLLLLVIVLTSSIVVMFAGVLIGIPIWGSDIVQNLSGEVDFTDASISMYLKYMQILSHLALFIIPAFFYAFLISSSTKKYFQFSPKLKLTNVLLGTALIFAVLPLINFLGEWNAALKLPESMAGIENWMIASEESAMEYTIAFLSVKSFPAFLFNIFMIAFIPAIGEELIFRGIVLKELQISMKNMHVAVIISALLFSTMHLQFYGFLPRFLLGILLGYIYVWSKNIFLPILIHFINNASAVIIAYFYEIGWSKTNMENFGSFDGSVIAIIISFVLSIVFMYVLFAYNRGIKTKNAEIEIKKPENHPGL
jgi:membrane protease YdiL (CAAX protease family)